MINALLQRLFSLAVVLFSVITITFLLIRISPGGPFDGERKIPPAIEKQLWEKYKLDGTLWQQYSGYIRDLLHGDLRLSTKYRNRTVNEILAQSLPVTLCLGGTAFLLASIIGIWLGTLAAMFKQSWRDYMALLLALGAISLPSYIIGPLLILVFSLHWTVFPVGGWGGFSHLVLPAITLAAPAAAVVARLMRGSMVETLGLDFVRTARAKGLRESTIVYRHALRIAIIPVVSYLGPLVVETVFNIPGAGGFFVHSILNRDGFLLGGLVIIYCVLLVFFNLLVDMAYGLLDPRIKSHV